MRCAITRPTPDAAERIGFPLTRLGFEAPAQRECGGRARVFGVAAVAELVVPLPRPAAPMVWGTVPGREVEGPSRAPVVDRRAMANDPTREHAKRYAQGKAGGGALRAARMLS